MFVVQLILSGFKVLFHLLAKIPANILVICLLSLINNFVEKPKN